MTASTSETLFRGNFHTLPYSGVITDWEGRFLPVNLAFLRFSRISSSGILGRTSISLGIHVWREAVQPLREELARRGEGCGLEVETRTKAGPHGR